MLANDFYSSVNKRLAEGGFEVVVKFNEKHPIYQAHFPQNPITPGVCILQIGKELLSEHYNMPLTMTKARNIKFLHVINPVLFNQVCFKVSSSMDAVGIITANISVEHEGISFTKISSTYK